MGKLPYMKFYPGDWLKDPSLRRCTHSAKGVYVDVLCFMWECDERGVLATSGQAWCDEEIARAVGGDQSQTIALLAELVDRGVVSRRANGALYSRRMVREEDERRKSAARMKKSRERHEEDNCHDDSCLCDVAQCVAPDVALPVAPLLRDAPEYEYECNPPDVLSVRKEREVLEVALEIYEAYPKKVGKADALKAIRRALTRATPEVLREAVAAFAAARAGQEQQFTPNPATWFNQDRWNDDRKNWEARGTGTDGNWARGSHGAGQSATRIHSEGASPYDGCV